MTQERADRSSAGGAASAGDGAGPADALAQRVVAALVDAGLVSGPDGESIRADLAAGRVDAAQWRIVIENQLERKARSNERR